MTRLQLEFDSWDTSIISQLSLPTISAIFSTFLELPIRFVIGLEAVDLFLCEGICEIISPTVHVSELAGAQTIGIGSTRVNVVRCKWRCNPCFAANIVIELLHRFLNPRYDLNSAGTRPDDRDRFILLENSCQEQSL